MKSTSLLQSPQWISFGAVFVLLIVLFIAKHLFISRLNHRAKQEQDMKRFYKVLVLSLNSPLSLLIFTFLTWIVRYLLQWFELFDDSVYEFIGHIIKIALIVTVVLFIERMCTHSIKQYASQSPVLQNSSGIAKGAIRAILITLGVLIVLGSMGISITPLIASLGITSLAVALALQPTLENFFSGVQLIIDKPIRIGDYIELDSGEQGFVEKIGWRSTWIRMLPNNSVIMPNSKLSQSKVINYYYPEKELSVPVEVGVHYSSDLDHVERVCIEVAKEVLSTHEMAVSTYEPFVLFHTFDNSSINLTVMIRAKEYFNRFFIKSAFIKLLHKRFEQEGIVIPFPITALNLDQEQATFVHRDRDSKPSEN